jgi:hypothetical protein
MIYFYKDTTLPWMSVRGYFISKIIGSIEG